MNRPIHSHTLDPAVRTRLGAHNVLEDDVAPAVVALEVVVVLGGDLAQLRKTGSGDLREIVGSGVGSNPESAATWLSS